MAPPEKWDEYISLGENSLFLLPPALKPLEFSDFK